MKNTKILHKQKMRFTIDVEVSVRDLPQALLDRNEKMSEYERWEAEHPGDFRDYMEFQKRFLYAALSNPDITSQLIIDKAGYEAAEDLSHQYLSSHEPSLEEILMPVIKKLSIEDKNRVQNAIEHGVLYENTETALYHSFTAKVINSTVERIDE